MLAVVQRMPRRVESASCAPVGTAAFVLAWLAACAVQAQSTQVSSQRAALQLEAHACPELWAGQLDHFVRIELGAEQADDFADTRQPLEVRVRCAGDIAEIEITHAGTERATERRMDLSATAQSVRARVVALAIAGLARELSLIAREARAGERAPIAAAPAEPSQAEQSPPPGPRRASAVQLDVLLLAGNFAASQDVIWGGGARFQYLAHRPFRIALDLQAGTYGRRVELGTARLVTASLGARLGWTLASGGLAFTPGIGQRLGIASASASAADSAEAGSVLAAWTAPLAFAAFDAAVFGPYRAGLDAEVGAVLLPIHGRIQGGADLEVGGLWLALSATFGAQF